MRPKEPSLESSFALLAGWPVVAPGLLMANIDNVLFMHLDARMSDASYALYLHALEASLRERPVGTRVAVIYDIPQFSGLRALGARGAAEMFAQNRDSLRMSTACFALVSPSTAARVAAQTVIAVAGLPFPCRVCSTIGSALAFAATLLPNIEPRSFERRIQECLDTHEDAMRGAA